MKLKKMALLVAAVSLAAGAVLSSCKQVEPTALNADDMQYVTKVKGVVYANLALSKGSEATLVELSKVAVTAKISILTYDDNGDPVLTFVTSVSAKTNDEGQYTLNLPLASGLSYEIELASSSEQNTYDGSSEKPVLCSGKTNVEAVAGQEYVSHIYCEIKGYIDDPEAGKK